MTDTRPRRILTIAEVADRTAIPIRTLKHYRLHGTGPKTFILGNRIVAFEDDVNAWILDAYRAEQDDG